MNIRVWEEKDLAEIAAMEKRCFTDPWSEESLAAALSSPLTHCFLLEERGQVCGYACLFVLFEEAELQNIAIDLPYRGQGLGKKLLEYVHGQARALGAEKCFLEVRAHNLPAIRLYEGAGYEKYGERAKYYEDGENAFVMRKDL